jgi:predicted site-specific integrase-resolvase
VIRWERDGRLTSVRTPSGRHRYRIEEVRALVAEQLGQSEANGDGAG